MKTKKENRKRWVCLIDPEAKKITKGWLRHAKSQGDLFDRLVRFAEANGFNPKTSPNFGEAV